jgi:ribosomal protein S18 acetylase RimI-like enzyme
VTLPTIRRATESDVDELLRLRAVMFEATDVEGASTYWARACRQILLDGLSSGDLVAAVAVAPDGAVVACGIAALHRWLPSPTNPTGLKGYLGSMATDPEWRRQGIGRRIAQCLIAALQQRGVTEIELHASEDGEGVYRALGFAEPKEPMLTMQSDSSGF